MRIIKTKLFDTYKANEIFTTILNSANAFLDYEAQVVYVGTSDMFDVNPILFADISSDEYNSDSVICVITK